MLWDASWKLYGIGCFPGHVIFSPHDTSDEDLTRFRHAHSTHHCLKYAVQIPMVRPMGQGILSGYRHSTQGGIHPYRSLSRVQELLASLVRSGKFLHSQRWRAFSQKSDRRLRISTLEMKRLVGGNNGLSRAIVINLSPTCRNGESSTSYCQLQDHKDVE
jgi:hypothetical protein